MQKGRTSELGGSNILNRSLGSTSFKQQLFNTSALIQTATVDVADDSKSAESLRTLQTKNFIIKLQFALIVLLALAAALLNFKVNRMCAHDPPIVCRADL